MGYFLITLGLVLAYLDYLGTANLKAAGGLTWEEMTAGSTPFYKWLGAMIIIGMLGYIPDLKPVAQALMVLVLVAIVLNHRAALNQLVGGL